MKILKNVWLRLSMLMIAASLSQTALAGLVCEGPCEEPTTVAEPGTLALFGLGLASIILIKKFRK